MSNDKQTIIKTNKKDDINIIKDIYYIYTPDTDTY